MSFTRRVLRGTPLLISAAGAVVTIACGGGNSGGGHPVGNLMPPPERETIEVCVQVTPPEAQASATLNTTPVDDRGCAQVSPDGPVMVDINAAGFQPVHEEVPAQAGQTYPYQLAPAEGATAE